MEKYIVRLEPIGKTIEVVTKTPLVDVLHEFGIEFPCGGRGSCGGCKVRLLDGNISLSDKHKKLLSKLNLGHDWFLACLSAVEGDLTLEVDQFEHLILADNSSFSFEPKEGYGVVVDLGSSTIVVQLIDMQNASVQHVETAINPQTKFGADIITRIGFALSPQGLEEMADLIRKKVGELVYKTVKNEQYIVNEVVIVGNTAMHHIFGKIDVSSLSQYPFDSKQTGQLEFTAQELSWKIANDVKVRFLPAIGSFVGGDILAGIIASKIYQSEDYIALIDLGTNGEIVIGNKNKIVCASTAAGPAFEGTNIEMGMRAVSGAISSINIAGEKLACHVIGNIKAKGICGSGLIDAIACAMGKGLIDSKGTITIKDDKILVTEKIFISQKDIREFQLAKAAVAAGIRILAQKLEIDLNQISKVYIAGGFGNFINIENAIKTGLIEFPKENIYKLGNTALLGAKLLLFDSQNIQNQIINLSSHISLDTDKGFQDIFAEKMMFREEWIVPRPPDEEDEDDDYYNQ